MKKNIIAIVTVMIVLTSVLAGCGKSTKKYAGEYIGTSGSYLKLLSDGTCVFTDGGMFGVGTGTGTWEIDEDEIIVHTDILGFDIYADISDYDDGLMFESDTYLWNTEYFDKQEK